MEVFPEEATTSPSVPRITRPLQWSANHVSSQKGTNRDPPGKITCRSPRTDVWVRYIIKEGERLKKLWVGKGEVTGDSYLVTWQKWGHKPEQPKGGKEKSTWWRTGQVPNGQGEKLKRLQTKFWQKNTEKDLLSISMDPLKFSGSNLIFVCHSLPKKINPAREKPTCPYSYINTKTNGLF